MKCFALNINIFSSPHDVMQIARINKLFVQERKCLFLSEISEIFENIIHVLNMKMACKYVHAGPKIVYNRIGTQ